MIVMDTEIRFCIGPGGKSVKELSICFDGILLMAVKNNIEKKNRN